MNDYIDISRRNEAWQQIRSNSKSKKVKLVNPIETEAGEWQDPWSPPKK